MARKIYTSNSIDLTTMQAGDVVAGLQTATTKLRVSCIDFGSARTSRSASLAESCLCLNNFSGPSLDFASTSTLRKTLQSTAEAD